MAEYRQEIQERAQATIAVWQEYFDDLTLGATGSSFFATLTAGLPEPGTPAAASLDTIPTTTVSSLPDALRMTTFSQGGVDGLQLIAAYMPYALDPDETAVLQFMRVDIDALGNFNAEPAEQKLGADPARGECRPGARE